MRVKYLLGMISPLTITQAKVLDRLSLLLNEGSTGFSQRDFGYEWIEACLQAAAKAENKGVVTPQLAIKVLSKLLDSATIQTANVAQKFRWLGISQEIRQKILMPRIEADVLSAVGFAEGDVDTLYSRAVAQYYALSKDIDAKYYEFGGQTVPINLDLLRELNSIYFAQTGKEIIPQELITFTVSYGAQPSKFYPPLIDAIKTYLAEAVFKTVSLQALVDYGRGQRVNAEVGSHYSRIADYLERYLGYPKDSIPDMLELVHTYRTKTKR
jgi:hypothetical protein